MAEEDDNDDDENEEDGKDADSDEGEGEGDDKKGKKKGKSKLLIIIVGVLLLIIIGVAGAYFVGLLDPILGGSEVEESAEGNENQDLGGVYYELPELLVNLNTGGRESSFLKMKISLELGATSDIPLIEKIMPLIIDNFQVYLRELRIDDLQGAAGMYRLREELLIRVNAALAGIAKPVEPDSESEVEVEASPRQIKDVLFREMLVQ